VHRYNDLVARTELKPLQGEVQPGPGRADGHGFDPAAQEVDEGALEALRLGAGGDPAGAQAVDHLGNLRLTKIGYREGQDVVPADVSPLGHKRSEIVRAGSPGGLRSQPRIAPVRTKMQVEVVSHQVALSGILLQLRRVTSSSPRSTPVVGIYGIGEWPQERGAVVLLGRQGQLVRQVRPSRHAVAAPQVPAPPQQRLRHWLAGTILGSDRTPTGPVAGRDHCH
jgi:hypothetical protein